jgi:hypothetical protein
MKKSSVTQVTTFEKLLGQCKAQGVLYNPANDSLKVPALTFYLDQAKKTVEGLNHTQALYGQAVFQRKETFGTLSKFITRIVHALKASNAPAATIAEAYRYKNRFSAKVKSRPAVTPSADAANGDPPVKRTKAQYAFDDQLSNFETLVKIVVAEPSYKPAEVDLTAEALTTFEKKLHALNDGVINSSIALATARKDRDKVLFSASSITKIASDVKAYARSVFGTQHKAFKEINSLRFLKTAKVKAGS